jgi:phosphatidylglycerol:prolipoprotein diacylglycerol transferase
MFPKLIDSGSFYLPMYGVLVATAFLVAIWITGRLGKRAGLSTELITNLAVYCALAGMIGAKLLMFIFDWQIYAADPSQIFTFSTLQAAGVYQGGLLLAFVTALFYMHRMSMPKLLTCDVFAPGLALGHAIGRMGCFAAGCCWGQQCDRSWAVTFRNPDAHELTGVPLGVPLHPTQLYEAGAELLIFLLLYYFIRRPHKTGNVIGLYLVLYSIVRFIVEFFRHHDQALPFGGPWSLTQWISLLTLAIGAWLISKPQPVLTGSPSSSR